MSHLPGLRSIRRIRETAHFLRATLPTLVRASGTKILFQRHGGVGDVVCTFPAVLSLRQKFPGATIVYRVLPPFIPIVQMGRVADRIVPIHNWQLSLPPLCEGRFDMVFQPFLEDERSTGSRQMHLVDDFCALVGVSPSERQPRLAVSQGLGRRILSQVFPASSPGKPLVAIHTTPNWRVKEWSDGGWQALVSWLVNERHACVIQLGAAVYRKGGAVKVSRIEGAVDCVGRFSLEETAACIQACDLFIGVDSGPLHMAGAVGTPCVGLFGPVDPKLRLPPGTPSIGVVGDVPCLGCHHRVPIAHWQDNCPMEVACMKSLPIARVAAACDSLLTQSDSRRNDAAVTPSGYISANNAY
jgi:ADP-heptose:LPS heptosyltransferase